MSKIIFGVLILLLAIIVHIPVIRFHQDYRTSVWFLCIRSVVWVHFYLLKNVNASAHISQISIHKILEPWKARIEETKCQKNIEVLTWFVVINTRVKRKCIKVFASLGHKKSGVLLQVVYRRTYLNFSIKHLFIADNWMIRSLFYVNRLLIWLLGHFESPLSIIRKLKVLPCNVWNIRICIYRKLIKDNSCVIYIKRLNRKYHAQN